MTIVPGAEQKVENQTLTGASAGQLPSPLFNLITLTLKTFLLPVIGLLVTEHCPIHLTVAPHYQAEVQSQTIAQDHTVPGPTVQDHTAPDLTAQGHIAVPGQDHTENIQVTERARYCIVISVLNHCMCNRLMYPQFQFIFECH